MRKARTCWCHHGTLGAVVLLELAISKELEFTTSTSSTKASSLPRIQQIAIATATTIREERNSPTPPFCVTRSLNTSIGRAMH